MLETNIPLAPYTDTMVAADTGIAITVQQITTETDAPVVQSERGDPDGDGTVSVQDAVMVLTYYAKKSVGLKPETDAQFQYIQRGDIDVDVLCEEIRWICSRLGQPLKKDLNKYRIA